MIVVRISDSIAAATMIDRHAEISSTEPVYSLRLARRSGRSCLYEGDELAWRAWLRIVEGNASGALDDLSDRRKNAEAAKRIREAIGD